MAGLESQGRFDRIKGRIRSLWGDITDDDIERSRGNMEELVGIIKQRTGESAEAIRERLGELFRDTERDDVDRPRHYS